MTHAACPVWMAARYRNAPHSTRDIGDGGGRGRGGQGIGMEIGGRGGGLGEWGGRGMRRGDGESMRRGAVAGKGGRETASTHGSHNTLVVTGESCKIAVVIAIGGLSSLFSWRKTFLTSIGTSQRDTNVTVSCRVPPPPPPHLTPVHKEPPLPSHTPWLSCCTPRPPPHTYLC